MNAIVSNIRVPLRWFKIHATRQMRPGKAMWHVRPVTITLIHGVLLHQHKKQHNKQTHLTLKHTLTQTTVLKMTQCSMVYFNLQNVIIEIKWFIQVLSAATLLLGLLFMICNSILCPLYIFGRSVRRYVHR